MPNSAQFNRHTLAVVKAGLSSSLAEVARLIEGYLEMPASGAVALEKARTELHTLIGVLSMVGLDGVAVFCSELAAVLNDLSANPAQFSVVHGEALRRALTSVTQYLDALDKGADNAALRLFPEYRELQQLRGLEMSFELDLFYPNLDVELPQRVLKAPIPFDARARLRIVRGEYQQGLLRWLRQEDGLAALQQMQQALEVAMGCVPQDRDRAFWWVASGLLECLKQDDLHPELNIRKLLGRIDQHLRCVGEGSASDVVPVMNEMLYIIGHRRSVSGLVDSIRETYALERYLPENVAASFDQTQEILGAMRDGLRRAQENWELCVQGDKASCEKFRNHVQQLASQSERLDRPILQGLIRQVQELSVRVTSPEESRSLAMDMAMNLLLLESGIRNYLHLGNGFDEDAHMMGERFRAAIDNQPGDPSRLAELVHLHDQLEHRGDVMASLINEILANLQRVEQDLNTFFDNPDKSEGLTGLLGLLRQIKGAACISSLGQAEALVTAIEDSVQGFIKTPDDAKAADKYVLAEAISALQDYMQHLMHGQSGNVWQLEKALSELAERDNALGAGVTGSTGQGELVTLALPTSLDIPFQDTPVLEIVPAQQGADNPPAIADRVPDQQEILKREASEGEQVPARVTANLAAEENQDVRQAFVDEGREVLSIINSKLAACRSYPDDHESLAGITRSFHTLKGSSRMLGLGEIGDVARMVEELLERWLQRSKSNTPELLRFIDMASGFCEAWIDEFARHGGVHVEAGALAATAKMLGDGIDGETTTEVGTPSDAISEPSLLRAADEPSPSEELISGDVDSYPGLVNIAAKEVKENVAILRQELERLRAAVSPSVSYDFMRAAHTLASLHRNIGEPHVAGLAAALEGWLDARLDHVSDVQQSQLGMLERAIAALEGEGEIASGMYAELANELTSDRMQLLGVAPEPVGQPPIGLEEIATQELSVDSEPEIEEQTAHGIMLEQLFADINLDFSREFEQEQQALADEPLQTSGVKARETESEGFAEGGGSFKDRPSGIGVASEQTDDSGEQQEVAAPSQRPLLAADQDAAGHSRHEFAGKSGQVHAVDTQVGKRLPDWKGREADSVKVCDELDPQMLPVFLEEAQMLLEKTTEALHAWRRAPQDEQLMHSVKRVLHTLKGSSRMAGAMRLGEAAHQMEDRLEAASKRDHPQNWQAIDADLHRIAELVQELRKGAPVPAALEQSEVTIPDSISRVAGHWGGIERRAEGKGEAAPKAGTMLRIRSDVMDRLANDAGEISVVRSRMETDTRFLTEELQELAASISRLRQQLRDVEIQAESQMPARALLAKGNSEEFDPLEFDRFSRLQELTRFLNESVHDVEMIQQSMGRHLDDITGSMQMQGRISRGLQQDLMDIRMVSFSSIADRLYRIVRQTGRELNKRVNLELRGTNVEVDRSVLERMVAPFEHLLRNAIVHGLESETERELGGKLPIGEVRLTLRQEGNELVFEFSDDGAGLDFAKLREKAIAIGKLTAEEDATIDQLAQLIFIPGLSTTNEITEVAGRGIGMDVVRSEISALGGRIDISSWSGRGTRFIIHLPLTLAVTQVLLVRAAERNFGIPSTIIEHVMQVKSADMDNMHRQRRVEWIDHTYPLHYLPHLLGKMDVVQQNLARNQILLLRSGEQGIALHVDELLGNQEVMVKNMGPQLARLSGIAGATVMADGTVLLILNPIRLVQRINITKPPKAGSGELLPAKPLIMVVDDSLTVRKITSRMLVRAGYQVVTAKDGLDALEKLEEFMPAVMLLDIEMPRMDGFALVKQLRCDPKTRDLPIIMITSRTAEKHREYAMELGVNTYLGKPYQDDDLLQNIADFVAGYK